MIETQHVSKAYGEDYVLDDVSVSLPRGKVISLIGANGAGKSTLLSIISRLLPGEGSISIDGTALETYKADDLSRHIAVLRQSNVINARLTVRDLVRFGRYPHSHSRLTADDLATVEQAIDYMELEALSERFLDELSGGERQRALIAMIIAQDTDYILLDEPLNNLDMKHSVQIMKLLRRLVDEQGKTVVLVIHDINFASCYSDYIVALKDGVLLYQGDVGEIMTSEHLRNVFDMDFNVQEINGKHICLYYA